MNKIFIIIFWFIIFMSWFTFSCDFLTQPNTILNIIGFIALAFIITISIQTKCFTSTNIKLIKTKQKRKKKK